MTNIHYSWWLFHEINQKSLNKDIGRKVRTISRFMDTMLKNKVVHLSTIHGNTFEIPPIFFQQENSNILLQKEVVLLTITFQFYWGKNPHSSLRFLLLYKRKKIGWAAQSDLWASQPLVFPTLHFFPKIFYKILINTKQTGPL